MSLFLGTVLAFSVTTVSSLAAEWNPQTDLRLGLNGRTYPIGAQIAATAGIGQALWGDLDKAYDDNGKVNFKYGYTRLGLNLATSAVVNRVGLEFQLFPISILGFGAGYDIGSRNFTPKTIDCSVVECNGAMTRKYLRMQLLAAYQGFIFSLQARYEELRAPDALNADPQKPFFDEMTLTVGNPNGEDVLSWTPIVLYRIDDRWQAGGAVLYAHAIDTGGDSLLYGPVAGYKPMPEMNVLAGVGLNRSPVVHSAITGFFVIQWMLKGGIGLTDRIVSEAPAQSSKSHI